MVHPSMSTIHSNFFFLIWHYMGKVGHLYPEGRKIKKTNLAEFTFTIPRESDLPSRHGLTMRQIIRMQRNGTPKSTTICASGIPQIIRCLNDGTRRKGIIYPR